MPSRSSNSSRRQRGYPTASEIRAGHTAEEAYVPCMDQDRVDTLIHSLRASVESAERAEQRERDRTLARLTSLRDYAELSERPSAASSSRPRNAPGTTVCHFFALNGSCRNGDSCAFSHNVTPGDTRSVVCSFFRKGNCRYGESCRFSHDLSALESSASPADSPAARVCQPCDSTSQASHDNDDDELICGICMEHPTKFGLLSGCDHVFCFECLMEWRSSSSGDEIEQKSLVKVCPVCRTHSDYVLSSYTFANKQNGKEDLMAAHKLRLSQIPCKRFNGDLGSCPFGRDCFYRHFDEYGNDIKALDQSKQDIQEELERRKRRRREHLESQHNIDAELEILEAQLHLLQLGLASFAFQMDI